VCKQKWTTFVDVTQIQSNNCSWRHNVFMIFYFNFASISTLLLHNQSIIIRPRKCYCNFVTLSILSQNLYLNINNTNFMKKCRCSQVYEWNSFEYTFILRDSLRNGSGNNWFTFVFNFIFCLYNKDVFFILLMKII